MHACIRIRFILYLQNNKTIKDKGYTIVEQNFVLLLSELELNKSSIEIL